MKKHAETTSTSEKNGRKNRRKFGAIAAVLCLAVAGGLATYAWLTAQSSLTNNFTSAGINNPTTDPDDPEKPIPGDNKDTKLNGNLYESEWVNNSKLTPGSSVAKNPRVGIGAGSESAYVYLYVKNDAMSSKAEAADKVYFTIDSTNWKAVDGQAYTDSNGATVTNAYTGGLFVYTGGTSDAAVLKAQADNDVWTTSALFDEVTVPSSTEKADFADSPKITVSSYVYASDATATGTSEGTASAAETGAKAWAASLNTAA